MAGGDAGRLRQVLVNLVGNALKFTERGGVAVRVGVRGRSTATRWCCGCSVSDTGIGIPADRLEAIFEPFTQADGAMTRRFGGTGLGPDHLGAARRADGRAASGPRARRPPTPPGVTRAAPAACSRSPSG